MGPQTLKPGDTRSRPRLRDEGFQVLDYGAFRIALKNQGITPFIVNPTELQKQPRGLGTF